MEKTSPTFVVILLSISLSYGQINEQIKENVIENFKASFVESNFKDPYSFEILKFESHPIDTYNSLREDCARMMILNMRSDTTKRDFANLVKELDKKNKQYSKLKDYGDQLLLEGEINDLEAVIKTRRENFITSQKLYDRYQNQLDNLTDDASTKTREYKVYLDCYGNNSYGAKILGRYKFNVDLDGNIKTDIKILN